MTSLLKYLPTILIGLLTVIAVVAFGTMVMSGVPLFPYGLIVPAVLIGPVVSLFRFRGKLNELAGDLPGIFGGLVATDGPLAVGTVRGIEPTGMLVNDVRRYVVDMDVHTPEGTEFSGQMKTLIPEHELDVFKTGVMLPVMYNPARPDKISLAPESRMAEAQEVFDAVRIRMGLVDTGSRELSDRGVTTRGVIVETVPTGDIRHGHTEMELKVRFPLADGTMVERTRTTYVSPVNLDQLSVGSQVEIVYLPYDDSRFMIQLALVS